MHRVQVASAERHIQELPSPQRPGLGALLRATAVLDSLPHFLLHRATQILVDALLCALSIYCAYQLRFDGAVPPRYAALMWGWMAVLPVLRILTFSALGVYGIIWRYFTLTDASLVAIAAAPPTVIALLLRYAYRRQWEMFAAPASTIVIELGLFVACAAGIRVLRRISAEVRRHGGTQPQRTLIIGTPDALSGTLRHVGLYPDVKVVGLLSPDTRARGLTIGGFRVIDEPAALPKLLVTHGVQLVLIADAGLDSIGAVVATAIEFGVDVRLLPSAANVVRGDVRVTALRQPDATFVDRAIAPIETHPAVVEAFRAKTVLITGAGGSIGAELSRQVASLAVERVVLFDHDENAIFEIHRALRAQSPSLALVPVVGDIRDGGRLQTIFEQYRPHVVLHAAAYKHVPVMEQNVCEAVLNNVIGTRELADVALQFGTERFLMISTDKAVEPTSIMGASKRAAELLVQARGGNGQRTRCACVRFGNVVGSRGSVVPIFLRQIAAGGPVTITDEEMTRYFMTIPEAVQLVLQASTLGSKGDLYMLDMGDPMKIVDVARKLIRLSGLRPEQDIKIEIVGARPGEKIHERLWHDGTRVTQTQFARVLRVETAPDASVEDLVTRLDAAARRHDEDAVRAEFRAVGLERPRAYAAAPAAAN